MFGFLLQRDNTIIRGKLNNTITLRILHVVPKDCRTGLPGHSPLSQL